MLIGISQTEGPFFVAIYCGSNKMDVESIFLLPCPCLFGKVKRSTLKRHPNRRSTFAKVGLGKNM